MMQFQFLESCFNGITHQFAYFSISHIDYVMDFTSDADIVANLVDDPQIYALLNGKSVYTVKFAVKEYYESDENDIDLYAPPKNYKFNKKEINCLKEQLETLFYQHYLNYKPDCYFFIGERPSLVRMYQKMCDNRHPIMLDFKPITQLGNNKDCFIIKTPLYDARIK
ncbi:helicase [Avibacterium volantium]|uniref:Uncharacterized protein n=1 Tax=Avibacterium volantium TaxID=762 RepID=A0A3S4HTN3_AVIVO|nr:helicase [Avibacterium volantium]VEB24127.1 Uncharacterised protein [Avibacterium volantium]